MVGSVFGKTDMNWLSRDGTKRLEKPGKVVNFPSQSYGNALYLYTGCQKVPLKEER